MIGLRFRTGQRSVVHPMKTARRFGLSMLGAIAAISIAATAAQAAPPTLKPVTVCEVLEDLPLYTGKMVAVVGRLSSDLLHGAWLAESDCRGVESRQPNSTYTIELSCYGDVRPSPISSRLSFDQQVLQVKLDRLRRSTVLGYHDVIVMSPQREYSTVQKRDKWAIIYGHIQSYARSGYSPDGKPGAFASTRTSVQLCAPEGAIVRVDEPEPRD
jgi:hypothetical protein